jgi:hypothetical protein
VGEPPRRHRFAREEIRLPFELEPRRAGRALELDPQRPFPGGQRRGAALGLRAVHEHLAGRVQRVVAGAQDVQRAGPLDLERRPELWVQRFIGSEGEVRRGRGEDDVACSIACAPEQARCARRLRNDRQHRQQNARQQ